MLYNVNARLAIIYEKIFKYSKSQLFAEYNYLCATNLQNSKTLVI